MPGASQIDFLMPSLMEREGVRWLKGKFDLHPLMPNIEKWTSALRKTSIKKNNLVLSIMQVVQQLSVYSFLQPFSPHPLAPSPKE